MQPQAREFVPLNQERRTHIPTPEAAHAIGREPQTLRGWACRGNGPVKPVRVHGRLSWPVAELRRLLGVAGPDGSVGDSEGGEL